VTQVACLGSRMDYSIGTEIGSFRIVFDVPRDAIRESLDALAAT